MSDVNKAKRRLSNFNFDAKGSHVAFVGPEVGGAANNYTTLITKAVNDIPEEIVEKATQVQVTMDFEEFLVKWFNMYYSDAEVLAAVLGMQKEEQPSDMYDYQGEHRKWIEEKVSAINIMKSVHASVDVKKAFQSLSYEDSLAVIEAQPLLEKAMLSVEGKSVSVTKGQNKPINKEENMSKEDVIQKSLHQELIQKAVKEAEDRLTAEKSKVEEVLKSAQAKLDEYQAKEQESITKARKDALKELLSDEKIEEIYKATQALDQEAFDVIVKSMKAQAEANSDLYSEAGVSGQSEIDTQKAAGTAAILKAKYAKAKA